MKNNEKDMLSDILSDFIVQNKEKVLYLSLQQATMPLVCDLIPNSSKVADLSILETLFSPAAPFMQYIKQQDPDIETIKKNTYPVQTDTFISYIKTGKTEIRKDTLLPREIHYEKERCIKSICNLLDCNGKNLYLILNGQSLGEQATKILEYFETHAKNSKIIVCFDTQRVLTHTHGNSFFSEINNKSNYYEINSYEKKEPENLWNSIQNIRFHYLSQKSTKELINLTRDSRLFFSHTEGFLLQKFFQIPENIKEQDPEDLSELYFEIASLEMITGSPDEAIFYLNYALENEFSEKMEPYLFFKFSQLYFIKGNYDNALFYIHSLLPKLKKDNYLYALSLSMEHICLDRARKQTTISSYQRVQEELKKYGLENNRIYAALYFPKVTLEDISKIPDELEIIEKVISDAEKIDNEFSLATAYQWKGIFLGKQGHLEESLFWQTRSHDIRKRVGDLLTTIRSSNGLAYEHLLRGNYEESYTMLNSFMPDIFCLKDNSEILVSLYNVSKNLFFMRNFNTAYDLLHKVSRIKKSFNLEDFFFCKDNDIIILKAIIDFLKGKKSRAKNALFNVEKNKKERSYYLESLTTFLKALLFLEENNLAKAISTIELIPEECSQTEHQLPFIFIEFSIQLLNYNHLVESKIFFDKAKDFATTNNFQHYINLYKTATYKNANEFITKCQPLLVNTELVEEMVSKQMLIDRVQRKIQDVQFLNNITTIGFRFQYLEEYAKSFCQKLFDYTLAESIFIAQRTEQGWLCLAQTVQNDEKPPTNFTWDKYIKENSQKMTNSLLEVQQNLLFANLSSYSVEAGLLIKISENSIYTQENQGIIQTAISQLQSALIIFQQRERLKQLSTTDQLTGINNRRAMETKIQESSDLIKRFPAIPPLVFSITFIDLDNFKFYNDTYGHKAGDILLISFSNLLQHVYRKIDYICRFGGDEFVILSTDVNSNPERAIERLREKLVEEKYFIPALEKQLHLKIDIDKTLKLGFSAGICINTQVEPIWDLERTIQFADIALRHAKNNGKNITQKWNPEITN